jgi:hypothetical protein
VASEICLRLLTSVCHIPLLKCAKDNSGTTRTLEAVMNFVRKFTFFQVLHYTVLCIHETEQWSLYVKSNLVCTGILNCTLNSIIEISKSHL